MNTPRILAFLVSLMLIALLCVQLVWDKTSLASALSKVVAVKTIGNSQDAASMNSNNALNSTGKMLGGNLQRTRVYDARGIEAPKTLLWTSEKLFHLREFQSTSAYVGPFTVIGDLPTGHRASNFIVVGKEAYFSVFLGDGYWFVVDLQTGKAKKKFRMRMRSFSDPVVAGELLFQGASDGSFSAYERGSWKAKWQIGRKDYYFGSSFAAVADGIVYFGGAMASERKGSVHAVEAQTGTPQWLFKVEGHPSPIALADGVVYFSDESNRLFALQAKTGQEIWRYQAAERLRTPVVMDGNVFISDAKGEMYSLDCQSGKLLWRTGKSQAVATAMAAYHGLIYYAWPGGGIAAVDARTGQGRWFFQTTKPCYSPVAANGAIYTTCLDQKLWAIEAETGKEKWSYKTKHQLYTTPVIADGIVYLMDEEGFMSALSE